ncbi:MAG: DNA polymerase III subunit gamma/tau [Pseudomonadota bacterium]|nr:DNA polymerase III subunit gamma/tau [Pseudomonadota bacterium]
MAYQPLARRYRPQTFAQVVGQTAVCVALRNAIKSNRVAPAIIFTGVRGTGKTTLARILAKSLNCEQKTTDGDACGECISCRAIAASNHEDVHEIDGASHTGVDDIRALQQSLTIKPQRSKQRIHIIDEVHMLSSSAFNALLKTLEEPVADTLFIFATTELSKIPLTIRSRCQIYYLSQLAPQEIVARINDILRQEKTFYDVEVVNSLAAQAEGSMRDALTILDQVILLGDGKITANAFQNTTSYLAPSLLMDLLAILIAKNTEAVLAKLEKISSSWLDYQRIAADLAQYTRHAFILKELPDADLSLPTATIARLLEIARASATLELNRLFRSLVMCSKELDASALDRYVFENYCLEWCLDPGLPLALPPEEKQPPTQQDNSTQVITKLNLPAQRKPTAPRPQPPPRKPTPPHRPATTQASSFLPSSWQELLVLWRKAQPLRARQLEDAKLLSYSPTVIKLAVNAGSMSAMLLQAGERQRVEAILTKLFNFKGRLEVQTGEQPDKDSTKKDEAFHPVIGGILEKFGGKITETYTDM